MASAPLPLHPSEQQQLHDHPPQQQHPEQPPAPIVPPPPRHPLKRIRVGTGPEDDATGREVSIALQNENGPCPLLAAANALIIRGDLSLGTSTTSISQVRVHGADRNGSKRWEGWKSDDPSKFSMPHILSTSSSVVVVGPLSKKNKKTGPPRPARRGPPPRLQQRRQPPLPRPRRRRRRQRHRQRRRRRRAPPQARHRPRRQRPVLGRAGL